MERAALNRDHAFTRHRFAAIHEPRDSMLAGRGRDAATPVDVVSINSATGRLLLWR